MYKFSDTNVQKLEFSFLHLNSIEPDNMPSPIVRFSEEYSHFIEDNNFLNTLNSTFNSINLNNLNNLNNLDALNAFNRNNLDTNLCDQMNEELSFIDKKVNQTNELNNLFKNINIKDQSFSND